METPSASIILLVVVAIIIISVLVYYIGFSSSSTPTFLSKSDVYTSSGYAAGKINPLTPNQSPMPVNPVNLLMITPAEAAQYLGENFTLSFYVTLTHQDGTPPNKYMPLIWIPGVGSLLVDMIGGHIYMVITSVFINPTNTASFATMIDLTGGESGKFFSKWHQIVLTVRGANVCVYVDGQAFSANCVVASNVTLSPPGAVYFLQGQGPIATVASVQAWPIALSAPFINANYTATSNPTTGAPTNLPPTSSVSMSDLGSALLGFACQTGLCPPPSTDTTLGPFTKINYEYS
jgi:hypothetical protein